MTVLLVIVVVGVLVVYVVWRVFKKPEPISVVIIPALPQEGMANGNVYETIHDKQNPDIRIMCEDEKEDNSHDTSYENIEYYHSMKEMSEVHNQM